MLRVKGLCTCDKCGAQCEVGQGLVLTVNPPINVHEYDCKKCGNHSRVEDKYINWVPEAIITRYFGVPGDVIEKASKEKETKVNEFLDDLLEHNPILITMDLENMKKIANGYLDQISTLYSLVASTYKSALENEMTPHMEKLNEQLENTKEALINLIKKNIKTDWCQEKDPCEYKVTGVSLDSIKVGSRGLKLDELDARTDRYPIKDPTKVVLDTTKE